jgi:hypothetical protein
LGALPVQGLDKDRHAFPETQRQVESALAGCCNQQGYDHPQATCQLTEVFTLWMMALLSSSGIILPSKGAPNPGPR